MAVSPSKLIHSYGATTWRIAMMMVRGAARSGRQSSAWTRLMVAMKPTRLSSSSSKKQAHSRMRRGAATVDHHITRHDLPTHFCA